MNTLPMLSKHSLPISSSFRTIVAYNKNRKDKNSKNKIESYDKDRLENGYVIKGIKKEAIIITEELKKKHVTVVSDKNSILEESNEKKEKKVDNKVDNTINIILNSNTLKSKPSENHKDNIYPSHFNTIVNSNLKYVYNHIDSPFLILYKPPGLICQGKEGELSIERILLKYRKKIYFPHQLDKDAQGLLVVAFNKTTCSALVKSLQEKLWIKRYNILAQLPPCIVQNKKLCNSLISLEKSQDSNIPFDFKRVKDNDIEKCFKQNGKLTSFLVSTAAINQQKALEVEKEAAKPQPSSKSKKVTPLSPKKESFFMPCSNSCSCVTIDAKKHPLVPDTMLYTSLLTADADALEQKEQLDKKNSKKKFGKLISPKIAISNYTFKGLISPYKSKSELYAHFNVQTETGRQHQLRAQFSGVGLPVAGDPLYNYFHISNIKHGIDNLHWDFDTLNRDQWLHPKLGLGLQASYLELPHPYKEGEIVKVEVELPEEWSPEKITAKNL